VGIVDEDISRVREATDIVSVISQYTQLKRVGRRFQGLCPFHSEKSGSFSVNAEDGLYYCFGCQVKGDAITFVREKEQLDFVAAVEWLAAKASITLNYTNSNEGEDRKRKSHLQNIVLEAVEWYHKQLLDDPSAGPARSYLRKRGFDSELVKRYKLGWSPDNWDSLSKALKVSSKDLTDAGLGFVNRRGRQQDSFRARIMFPIFDAQDKAVGFGGRIMPGADPKGPKYKNSSESKVYTKSRILYGLNWAKTDIVAQDRVIICEGYTDVIGFAQAGVNQAVATCGTSLTEDHVKLLRRFTKKVVLAFDADAAGQNAAERFYEWEKTYEVDVVVADIPEGLDQGELAISDPALLKTCVDEAKPFLAFRIDRLIRSSDLSSVEYRAKAAEKVIEMVREHPDSLVRDQYAMEISSRLRLQPELVRSQLNGQRSTKATRLVSVSKERIDANRGSPELEALKLLVADPETVQTLLTAELFSDDLCAAAYQFFVTSENLHDAIEKSGPEVGELLHKVSVDSSSASATDVASLLWRAYLERLMDVSRSDNQIGLIESDIVEHHTWMRMRLEELKDQNSQQQVVEDLVAWLGNETGENEDE